MAEHPNVQRIRDAYAAFSIGDLAAALKDLAPNAVFHFNGQGPLSGDHTGVDDITAALTGIFELTAGTQMLDIANVYADDHHGVVVLRETATRSDGAVLDIDEVHVLAIDEEGRITDLWDMPSDPEPTTGSSMVSKSPTKCILRPRPIPASTSAPSDVS